MIDVDHLNYLRPINFLLRVDSSEFSDVFYYCQSINLPGLTVGPVGNIRHSRAKVAIAGDNVEFEPFTAEFLIDEKMANYRAMYNWLINQVQSEDVFNRDMTLFIQNSDNNIENRIRFINALPTNLTPLDFSLKEQAVRYLTASVTFYFDYYEIESGSS